MTLQGNIVNGKFVDLHGMVYQITPPGAEILNSTDGSDTKDTQNTKNTTPSNGNGGNKTKHPTYNPPSPLATPPTPQATEQPPTPAAQPQSPQSSISSIPYPKCISFEILRAVQTPSMAQVSVRAHCKGQFADSVVHYDFEVYEQAPDTDIITFKQTALQSAHAEAIQIAKKLLCEQPEAKEAKKEVKK